MEKIEKIVELTIDNDLMEDAEEVLGTEIVSIVDVPAIQVDFQYFSSQEFIYPSAGEGEDEFIARCMGDSKMNSEYPNEDQRLAVCYSYYEQKLCDGKCEVNLESYDDYPIAARENACRAVKWAEENGWGDCGTQVGKVRAQQICNGEKISRDTIARMASFERHRQHKDVPYDEGCGGLMWDAWSGDEGINWAQRKLEQIDNTKEELVLSDEAQTEILKFCEDEKNGTYIDKDDIFLDFTNEEFSLLGDVINAIRGLDILKRLTIKKDEPAEIYYRYQGAPAQRTFCRAMMNLSKAGKIFSEEEITRMDGLNSQFSKRGSSSYSIFQWKGGVNCVHYWQKLKVFKNAEGKRVIITTNEATSNRQDNALRSNNSNKPGPLGFVPNNARVNFSVDSEKRIVLGPLMIPNKFILRRDENGEPYYIFFTRDTIKRMAERFIKYGKNNNTDVNHDENITTENTLIETWISESVEYDKSYKYGFALPPGTWYVSYKINNDDTWERIKKGELKGFSLAGNFMKKMKRKDNYDFMLDEIKDIIKNVKK